MTKTIRMKYGSSVNNMGDMLNELIPRDLFGVNVEHVDNIYESETTGIGSYLSDYFTSYESFTKYKRIREIAKRVKYFNNKSKFIRFWSTGFMQYSIGNERSIRPIKELEFSSVRGELSKQRIEKILGRKLDISTGDAGLLAAHLVSDVEKKYTVGVIPHFREQDEMIFKRAASYYPNAHWINLSDNPYSVIREIGECEVIISSSLHGLIVADSFGIPNIRVIKSNKMYGDGFKFDDYYSSFNVDSQKVYLTDNTNSLPSIDWIQEKYKIKRQDVQKKQIEIEKAFFKNLR